jgi:hypothetical protein
MKIAAINLRNVDYYYISDSAIHIFRDDKCTRIKRYVIVDKYVIFGIDEDEEKNKKINKIFSNNA